MQGMYSMRSPAVKRLMKEAQELREPTEQYACHPLEDNLFEWHFTLRGPADTEFDGGLYHGRIVLPPEYPMKPPSIIILTANGRFEINKKICLSISGHHPESWQPSWSLRTALLAIIGFMPTHGAGALGSLDYTPDERKILAKRSQDFKCPSCGAINNILKPVTEESKKTTEEARVLAAQIDFKDEKEKNAALKSTAQNTNTTEELTAPVADDTSDSASVSSSTQPSVQPIFSPPPFGQFPLRMPFFPPFPQMPQHGNTGTNTASHVPRFPLPFVSPFYPPMMHSGNFPMPPMVPGMQVPPWQQNNAAPFSPPSGESVAAVQRETIQPNVQSAPQTQTSNTSERQADSNHQNQSDTSPSETQNVDNTSINEMPPPIATPPPIAMPPTIATPPTIETSSTSHDGLRQRNLASTSHTQSHQSTEQHQRGSRSVDRALLVFAVFVVFIIALLVIRRLHMMKLITFLS